jgi:hypothetical protein
MFAQTLQMQTEVGGRERKQKHQIPQGRYRKLDNGTQPICVVVLFFARSKFMWVASHNSNQVQPHKPKEIVAA